MKLTIGNTQLKEKRFHAASVVINDTVLWITGGMSNKLVPLDTTEFIELFFENATAGTPPKLPNITLHRFFYHMKNNMPNIFPFTNGQNFTHLKSEKFYFKIKVE